jgi:hypothetical protein
MKFVKLSQKLKKYALNVRSVTLGYAHIENLIFLWMVFQNICAKIL